MVKLSRKLYVGIGLSGLGLAALSLPFVTQAVTSNTTVSLAVNPVISAYSTGPTVTLGAITPTSGGLQSAASDSISATTNDTAGLTVTLQENSASSTALLSGANTIPTTSGTTGTPVTLASNTWGWRVDSLAGFGAGPTSTISDASPSALTYAAIPANGAPFTILTTSSNGTGSVPVWYSARVNNTQAIGTYTSTVTYTITTN